MPFSGREQTGEEQMSQAPKQKQNYSAMTLEEAMRLIGRDTLTAWHLNAPPRPPGDILQEILRRLDSFDLLSSEPAKTLLIDALFVEIVPLYPNLKVWNEAILNTDTLTVVADYVIAPKRAYRRHRCSVWPKRRRTTSQRDVFNVWRRWRRVAGTIDSAARTSMSMA
jgi:hypothetical protein